MTRVSRRKNRPGGDTACCRSGYDYPVMEGRVILLETISEFSKDHHDHYDHRDHWYTWPKWSPQNYIYHSNYLSLAIG